MTTYVYTPTRDYPKEPQVDLSDEERDSFNINNKAQVAEIINLALKEIYKSDEPKPSNSTLFNSGQIIENMLENDFGEWLDDRSYREFVMDYVISNFKKAQKNTESISNGLRNGNLNDSPVGWK